MGFDWRATELTKLSNIHILTLMIVKNKHYKGYPRIFQLRMCGKESGYIRIIEAVLGMMECTIYTY